MRLEELNPYYRVQAKKKLEERPRAKTLNTGNSRAAAHKKRTIWIESMAAQTVTRFDGRSCITLRTTRRRDTDNRAVEEKYFVDGLVTAKVLPDDRKKYVRSLEVCEPEIGTDEKTVIRVVEAS